MSTYEFFDRDGAAGMLVIGTSVDTTFRSQADKAGRPDERLITVEKVDELLDQDALALAAAGLHHRVANIPADLGLDNLDL